MASRLAAAGRRGYPGTPWTDPDGSLMRRDRRCRTPPTPGPCEIADPAAEDRYAERGSAVPGCSSRRSATAASRPARLAPTVLAEGP